VILDAALLLFTVQYQRCRVKTLVESQFQFAISRRATCSFLDLIVYLKKCCFETWHQRSAHRSVQYSVVYWSLLCAVLCDIVVTVVYKNW